MSSDTQSGSASPAQPVVADFEWSAFTVRARGPVRRDDPIENDDDGPTIVSSAKTTLTIERPITGKDEFTAIVLSTQVHGGRPRVAHYLVEDIDKHRLADREQSSEWEITVEAPWSAWQGLADWVDEHTPYGPRFDKGEKILREAVRKGIAGPKAALVLAAVADDDSEHQRLALGQYAVDVGLDRDRLCEGDLLRDPDE